MQGSVYFTEWSETVFMIRQCEQISARHTFNEEGKYEKIRRKSSLNNVISKCKALR